MNRKSAILLGWMSTKLVLSVGVVHSDDDYQGVRPIIQQHCVKCHGAEEQNGGINFDVRSTIFVAADSGKLPVVAGNVDASELMQRVTSTDQNLRMPPEGDRLSEQQINLLRQWISDGASWSPAAEPATPVTPVSEHWAFQPISSPQPPDVQDSVWSSNPLDRFIQAKRESVGLEPVRSAEPVALIRRATYGLTGLPPTPENVQHFLQAADSPQGTEGAFADLVEELLARPSYGERWGRHWMDWVRYADTAGDNSDFPIPEAWLYRRYIIDSFNQDVPYNRFLTEQIAGDLLPAESQEQRNHQTIATGYLAMARRFGSLVERYPWHLTIEDTIDNMGRTMMGLTLSCARCHDHKFDPITTRDYYGLYGIFASTRYPFPGIELFQTQRDFVPLVPADQVDAVMQPHQAETDRLTAELDGHLNACQLRALENAAAEPHASLDEQRKMQDELDAMLIKARKAGEKLAEHLRKIPPVPTAYAVQDAQPLNVRIQIKGEPARPGAIVPRKFPNILGGQTLNDDAESGSGRLELASWITSPKNPLTARVIVNRIWQRHFGVGIVPSTSDFGLRGTVPTHPELLDWLASEFVRSGWSVKHLHRMIMNSRTYQMSSEDLEENLTHDPENHYYWKFNRQRLDAESIRDSLLMISGALDTTPLTGPYPIPPRVEWKYTQHHPFEADYPSTKRSVYLMTKRLTAKPYFQTFDGPDPNVCTSDRDQSVTPLQALYFFNDEFLHEQAERFARIVCESSDDDQKRAKAAFRTILCREPTATETDLLLKHIAASREQLESGTAGTLQAWSSLVRTLLRLNEFVYID